MWTEHVEYDGKWKLLDDLIQLSFISVKVNTNLEISLLIQYKKKHGIKKFVIFFY